MSGMPGALSMPSAAGHRAGSVRGACVSQPFVIDPSFPDTALSPYAGTRRRHKALRALSGWLLLVAFVMIPVASTAASPEPQSMPPHPSQADIGQLEESAARAHDESRFHEAIGIYSRLLKVSPQRSSALYGRGLAFEVVNRPDKAEEDYRNAILSDPGDYRAMESLAGLWERRGDHTGDAVELYRRALNLDPRPEWQEHLRFCIATLESRLRPRRDSAVGCWHRGNERLARGDSSSAFLWYTRALTLDPLMFQAFFSRGLLRLNNGDFETAITDFDEALRIAPRLRGGLVHRGLACERMGDAGRALRDLKQAVALDAGDPEAWFHLGRLQEENGDLAESVDAYRRALLRRPPPELAREVRERMGKAEAAGARAGNQNEKQRGHPSRALW
jgi:tetratricopeptide (TPR) repeat protein